MANQALWRVDRQQAKGLDATLAYDWSGPGECDSSRTISLRHEPIKKATNLGRTWHGQLPHSHQAA
jgi:hypothetical protein